MQKIGFIGMGSMGRAMAVNLAEAGFPLAVWNRSRDKAEGLPGAVYIAETPAEAARGADIVITMLSDDVAVEAVTFGPDSLRETLGEKAIHVCMSTISVAFSRRLAETHAAGARGYVSAPVFGRPEAAAAAKLWVVAGGPTEFVERCRRVFEAIGQGVFHVGEEAEKATLVKLAGNFTIAAMLESLGEAMALVRKAGVPAAQFLEIVNTALFKSPIYENYGGLVAREQYDPAGFKLSLGLKDLSLVLAAAQSTEVPMPAAGVIHNHMVSGMARGWANADWSVFAKVIAANAGLEKT